MRIFSKESLMSAKVLIIIPAFNEAENIDRVYREISENCSDVDIVIVNDCSTDDTVNVCRAGGYPYLDLYSNLGFSGAVQTGYRYAYENGYEIAVQFDGDGQHPAESILELVGLIEKDTADYVIGSRFVTRKKGFSFRMLGSRLISAAIRLRTGKKIKDPTSGMRAVRRSLIKKMAFNLNFIAEPDTLTRALLSGARVLEVQVEMKDRHSGISHFAHPLNSLKYMIRIIISILSFQGRDWQ